MSATGGLDGTQRLCASTREHSRRRWRPRHQHLLSLLPGPQQPFHRSPHHIFGRWTGEKPRAMLHLLVRVVLVRMLLPYAIDSLLLTDVLGYVDPTGSNTISNPWSFNTNSNLLYIDQPSGAGFSYSGVVNATYDILTQLVTPLKSPSPPSVNASFGYGTCASPDFKLTSHTTVQASKAVWHFAEHWLSSFPGYNTSSSSISVWVRSIICLALPTKADNEQGQLSWWLLGSGGCSSIQQELQGTPNTTCPKAALSLH